MTKKIQVKCPTCKSEFEYFKSNFRPFCSERCRMVDLGHWLDENYRVPLQAPVDIDELEAALEKKFAENGHDQNDDEIPQ